MDAIIIGAGPAGLTAAYELLLKSQIKPWVFEASADMGGISKTVNYKGNRIDIGGHRFFSKSDRVMNWWTEILPIEDTPEGHSFPLKYRGQSRDLPHEMRLADPRQTDQVMLVRSRLSRIYYLRSFFNYPVKLELQTIRNLGLWRMLRIGLSYLRARLFPLPEKTLEDFYINRFGRELYGTFFRDYTEKVWGVPCSHIAPDWGAQRVKGLSITRTLLHAVRQLWKKPGGDLAQKGVETSLIEYFLYPKFGPGQMWDTVAEIVQSKGGVVQTQHKVVRLHAAGQRIEEVSVQCLSSGEIRRVKADYVFSTMPVNELVAALEGVEVPAEVAELAKGLPFRDFITVGLLMKKLRICDGSNARSQGVADNWIYIQEPDVKVGRLQIFNNWSPYMVQDPDTVWIGLEYFVSEGDELWTKADSAMAELGIQELAKIGIIHPEDVLDSTVLRMKKTYPAYFGTYNQFDRIRAFLDGFENLFLVGRNGMHRYNNQDHSMLTAMVAVENIVSGRTDKSNIWDVNVEQDYHEEK
ncbi:NAD(P)/FAD-dependent oxidoreductase [bacterium]|nr:NAD(P)/FAD-dependent oxidoreductase [bacterium]